MKFKELEEVLINKWPELSPCSLPEDQALLHMITSYFLIHGILKLLEFPLTSGKPIGLKAAQLVRSAANVLDEGSTLILGWKPWFNAVVICSNRLANDAVDHSEKGTIYNVIKSTYEDLEKAIEKRGDFFIAKIRLN